MLQNFYNTTFFNQGGSPKFVRVYYDKRFSMDPYTAVFTKTAKMLDGYHRAALCMNSFGSYSKEELVAELGAAFLCAHAGISNETQENSAAYIQGWLRAFNNDKRMIMQAASAAQKAADYILNVRD